MLFSKRTVSKEGHWLEKNNKEGVFPLYLSEKKTCDSALLCKQIKLNQKNWLGNNFRQPYDCLFELLDNKVLVMSWKDFVNIYQSSNSICSWGK